MADQAQFDQIRVDLERLAGIFDFTEGHLGDRIVDAVVDGIERNCSDELDPDGHAWPPLSDAYAEWKGVAYPGQPMGRLLDHMLAPEQLRGVVRITPTEITMEYGVDEQARQEAAWFSEGNDRQPARPFYGLTREAAEAIDRLLEERHDQALR